MVKQLLQAEVVMVKAKGLIVVVKAVVAELRGSGTNLKSSPPYCTLK